MQSRRRLTVSHVILYHEQKLSWLHRLIVWDHDMSFVRIPHGTSIKDRWGFDRLEILAFKSLYKVESRHRCNSLNHV
jgi:hypothetical protein